MASYQTPYGRASSYEIQRGYSAVNPFYGQTTRAIPGVGAGTLVSTLVLIGRHPRIIVQHVPAPT